MVCRDGSGDGIGRGADQTLSATQVLIPQLPK